MKPLSLQLRHYLSLRRGLGFKLLMTEVLLRSFIRFANQRKAARITTELAVHWATQSPGIEPVTIALRYRTVRLFALHLSAIDPRTEVPPEGLLRCSYFRKPPYLYSDDEVTALINTARNLPSPKGLRGPTLATLLGILAVTGMRISEAINLDQDDVDLTQAILTIRHAKGDRVRLVPIHPTSCEMLRRFQRLRNRLCPELKSRSFFVSEYGTRLNDRQVRVWFRTLARRIGLKKTSARRGPRLHDFRHRFAIKVLLKWYQGGADVEAHLSELSTYLGHLHVSGTYWYLSATPELLQQATRRWRRRQGGPVV